MFGTRRLAKRSIVGTAVCCLWKEDGFYHSGVIQSINKTTNGKDIYKVYFSKEDEVKMFEDKELIGTGFQYINTAKFKKGQQVYITHNSREITGCVLLHDKLADIVTIQIQGSNKETIEVCRKLDDVRIAISRRSARLQEHQCTNYNELTQLPSTTEYKTQVVSQSIDVPHSGIYRHKERELKSQPENSFSGECSEYNQEVDGGLQLHTTDEAMAAMILTSFSCSPSCSSCNILFEDKDNGSQNSMGSSGVWGMEEKPLMHQSGTLTQIPYSFENDYISSSAPTCIGLHTFPNSTSKDEGIDIGGPFISEETVNESRKRKISTQTVFKCLWPDCGKMYNTCNDVEKHVRNDHLGTKMSSCMDHEEEFYYTEVDVNVDTVTQTFADMWTASPKQQNSCFLLQEATTLPDHDYQKKSLPVNIPNSNVAVYHGGGSLPASLSISPAKVSRSSLWQNNSAKVSKLNHRQEQTHGITPISYIPKKIRSDSKKCRKYYGIENKDLWCTQCKWKKACTRFMDYYNYTTKIKALENANY